MRYDHQAGGAMKAKSRLCLVMCFCCAGLLPVVTDAAWARTKANGKDGRPNILVIMTDDQAVTDLSAMPNLKALVAAKGVTFNNTVDSFPLCCPSRATFITGQYSHNHGVGGNFWPYGWYGMQNRTNILPRWLQKAGYYTAHVGKWLNGYGAGKPSDTDLNGFPLKTGGEIPLGFNNWNGSVDVSAYDYFNFAINQNGKLHYWGDARYAKALDGFAEIQVSPGTKNISTVLNWAAKFFGNPFDPSSYGSQIAGNYSPDVTAVISNGIIRSQVKSKQPFFLWWAPASPHREDVNGGIRNGFRSNVHYRAKSSSPRVEDTTKLVPDPRPAPRYATKTWDWNTITAKPSFDATPTNKPLKQQQLMASPLTELKKQQLQTNYRGRMSAVKAVDDGIKKLVNTLRVTKQLDNTIILFTSDNGWLQGEHRVPGDKYLPYEESIRVPFILSGPGISKNKQINTLVSNIDFAPTLLAAGRSKAGRTQDGISLLAAAQGKHSAPHYVIGLEANAPLFGDASMPQQWDQPYRGVRTQRWKYVAWCNTNDPNVRNVQTCNPSGESELYDLQNDPYEMTNLTDNPAYAATKAGLISKMNTLSHCQGASCRVP